MSLEYPLQSTILIVDDHPLNLQVLGSILRERGYKVRVAANGESALDITRHILPDLILLDIMMPKLDGFEVCRILKSHPTTSNIPIIFLTAKDDTESVINGFKLGAVDYITKPFKAEELVMRVETHLELKHSRDIIALQAHELLKANESKDRLFSIIGHDLRGPIGNIRSMLNIFEQRDRLNDEQYFHFVKVAKESAASSYTLLENLLQWAKSQRGEMQYNPQNINLKEATDTNIRLLSGNAEAKEIIIVAQIQPDIFVHSDYNMLQTILRNLLSNAIKFSYPNSTIELNVQTAITPQNFCIVSIKDNGIGMNTEQITQIFDSNKFITTYGTKNEKGSGLGLKLCIEFVKYHDGKLWVESTKNAGSTFYFSLPLATQPNI